MDTIIEPTGGDTITRIKHLFESDASDAPARIGQLLVQERARHERGTWMKWIAENCPFNYRTAEMFMDAYDDECRNGIVSRYRVDISKITAPKPERPKPEGWDAAVAVAEAIQTHVPELATVPRENIAIKTLSQIRGLKVLKAIGQL